MANYKIGVDFEANGSKAISAINQVSQAMQNLQNQVGISSRGTQSSVDNLTLSLRNLSSAFAGYLSARALGGFIVDSLKATATLEQMAISFQVFTGSAKVAGELMAQFKEQAIKSPMQFQDIVQGGKVLMNYGITAQQVIPITKMLGDISGGNADRFNRLALAFGQVNGAGRLMGQELRQMINAGFNPLQAISLRTGESMSSLTKRMHDGQISVREVGQAFVYATTEGGLFYKNAELQANSLGGKWSKFAETMYFAMAEVGKSIAKALNIGDLIDYVSGKLTGLVDSFKKVNDEVNANSGWSKLGKTIIDLGDVALRNLGSTLNNIKNAFSSVLSVIFNIIDGIKIMSKGLADFTKNVPILGKITGALSNYLGVVEGNVAKTADKSKVSVMPLAPMKKKDPFKDFLDSLNNKPSGLDSEDKMTKAEKAKLDKLIAQSKSGYTELENLFRSYTKTKLEIFDEEAKKELDALRKHGLDTSKVEKSQYKIRQEIASLELFKLSTIVNKGFSIEGLKKSLKEMVDNTKDGFAQLRTAMDSSIAKYRENNPFKYIQDDLAISAGFTNEQLANQKDAMQRFGAEFYQAQIGLSTTLANGFSEIIGSILAGGMSIEETFGNLGKLFLGAFGDFLITVGQSAIKAGIVKLGIEEALKGLFTGGGALIGFGMAAVGIGTAMKSLGEKASTAMSSIAQSRGSSSSAKSNANYARATGSSYSSGTMAYPTQSIRLAIDLTGAITASPTGYNINKSLETVLRVTGR